MKLHFAAAQLKMHSRNGMQTIKTPDFEIKSKWNSIPAEEQALNDAFLKLFTESEARQFQVLKMHDEVTISLDHKGTNLNTPNHHAIRISAKAPLKVGDSEFTLPMRDVNYTFSDVNDLQGERGNAIITNMLHVATAFSKMIKASKDYGATIDHKEIQGIERRASEERTKTTPTFHRVARTLDKVKDGFSPTL